jgi:hypothetical protein
VFLAGAFDAVFDSEPYEHGFDESVFENRLMVPDEPSMIWFATLAVQGELQERPRPACFCFKQTANEFNPNGAVHTNFADNHVHVGRNREEAVRPIDRLNRKVAPD